MKLILAVSLISLFGFGFGALAADDVYSEIHPHAAAEEGVLAGHTNYSEERDNYNYATNPLMNHAMDDAVDAEGSSSDNAAAPSLPEEGKGDTTH